LKSERNIKIRYIMLSEDVTQILARIRGNEWLQTYRDRVAFWTSLVMLSVAMSIFWEMFQFAKSTEHWPRWSLIFPFPFIFTWDVVFVCLLPAALIPERFRTAFVFVFGCVLISALIPAFMVALTTSYSPLVNFMENYFFVTIFHCCYPVFIVLIIRVIVRGIYRRIVNSSRFG
jgi:hypothetical protein